MHLFRRWHAWSMMQVYRAPCRVQRSNCVLLLAFWIVRCIEIGGTVRLTPDFFSLLFKKQAICKHLYSYLWRAINGLRQAAHLILKSWWAACCAHNSSSNPSLLRTGLVFYLSLSSSYLTRCLRWSWNPVNSHDTDILNKLKSCVLIDHF